MPLNPVERRLVLLREHWERFKADNTKRLLVWRVPGNAARLVECFFEAQKVESEYSSGDLFVVFDAPFEHSIQYSKALKSALLGQYEASREDLEKQGIAADWVFSPEALPDSATGFVQSLQQFGSRHHKTIGHLVAVLTPRDVSDPEAFVAWVSRCLAARLPERLRLLLVDVTEAPRLDGLTPDQNPQVVVDAPAVDGLSTAQETFAQEGATGPAAVFRNYLMGLVTLVEKGSVDQVKAKAADAAAFARKQGWSDQLVVIDVMVAGALLKERRCEEAVTVYRGANESAQAAAQAGHPAGQQLVIQTLFGEAGAHVAAGSWKEAAARYEEAAGVAKRIPNSVLAIEASRMQMFCHGKMGQTEAATECGRRALHEARRLKAESRAMTTAPIAALDLLRILEPARVDAIEETKRRLNERVASARRITEASALTRETTNEPAGASQVEQELVDAIQGARNQADRELTGIAAGGGEPFRDAFDEVRELLDSDWPESFLAAVPAVPRDQPAGSEVAPS